MAQRETATVGSLFEHAHPYLLGGIETSRWHTLRARSLPRLMRVLIVSFADMTAVAMSFACGFALWAHIALHQPLSVYLPLSPIIVLFPISYAAVGLCPGFALGVVESLRRLTYATSAAFLVLAASSFAFKADSRYSRATFAITWAVSLLLVPLCRSIASSIAGRFGWWREASVVFGTPSQIELTVRSLTAARSGGYSLVGALCPEPRMTGRQIGGVTILGGLEIVPELTKRGVTTILTWDGPSVSAELADSLQQTYYLVFLRDERQLPIERVQTRNLGGILGIEFTNELLRRSNQIVKRAIDVCLGTVLLLLAAPLIGLCGVIIKIASPGPVFFRQQREGLHGRRFAVWKLRTMHPNAEESLKELLRRDPDLASEWNQNVKLVRDPRLIPFVGHWLRRLSFDELPQLWNVVVGDMSLVGPRPFPEYHLRLLSPEIKRLRGKVRPGLTGLWQVTVRSGGNIADQERYDNYYIRNWSLWLDAYVLARTVMAVVTAKGAC